MHEGDEDEVGRGDAHERGAAGTENAPPADAVEAARGSDTAAVEAPTDATGEAPAETASDSPLDSPADASAEAASAQDVEPLSEETSGETDERLVGILESVLFACGEPITLARLTEVVAGPTRGEIRAALAALAARAEEDRRGIRLVEVAGGYQFRTAPEHAEWVRRLFQQRPWRLTRPTLETLAIIAYKQPITRAEIEAIRGVDVDSVLASLLARKLLKIVGRKDVIGRPLLYGTTRQFLEVFGLRDLAALPGLSEVASAMPESVEAGAAGGEETWNAEDRQDEGHPPAEASGGVGDLLAEGGGEPHPERPGDGERHDGDDAREPGSSD